MKFIVEVNLPEETAKKIAACTNNVHRNMVMDQMILKEQQDCYNYLKNKIAKVAQGYSCIDNVDMPVTVEVECVPS